MRILYICTGNSFRSPVAEALTRKFHPEIEVESAGTNATNHIAGNAKQMLEEEEALRYVKPSPDQVSRRAVEEADKIVAMTDRHEEFLKQEFEAEDVDVWNIKDPIEPGVSPEKAFERIEKKVKEL